MESFQAPELTMRV